MFRPALMLLSAGLLSAMVATGCGVRVDDGRTVSQDRAVAPFQRIALDGSPDVDVVLGDRTRVVVRGGRKVVDQIHTDVRDGTLHVNREDHDTLVLDENAPHVEIEERALRTVADVEEAAGRTATALREAAEIMRRWES